MGRGASLSGIPMAFRKLETQLLYPELEQAVENGDAEALEILCEQLALEDVAELVGELAPDRRAGFFEKIPLQIATDVFQQLDVAVQRDVLDILPAQREAEIINEMDPDDRTALLETLPVHDTKQLLSFLKPRERALAQKLLEFPEDSVARLMTPDFLAIPRGWTVARALEFIRANGEDKETLNNIYVVDEKGRLIDDIRIRDFLLSPLSRSIEEIMDGQVTLLNAVDTKEEAIQAFRKYNTFTALPVVDEDGILLGIVTIDDIRVLEEKETTEDIQKIGGVAALEESYLEAPFWSVLRKRVGWLTVLFIGEMFTATAMSFYEIEISKAVVLALFIPLIISSGGNSGSQAATLVIRAIALGEVSFADAWKVLRRELVMGLGLGCILAFIGFLRVLIWGAAFHTYGEHFMIVGVAIGIALVGVVAWGTLVGAMLPLALRRLGLDPATSSAPFVATFIDVTGIVLYFNIAMWVMGGKLF